MPAAQRVSLGNGPRVGGILLRPVFDLCHEGVVDEVVGVVSIIQYRGCPHGGLCNGTKDRHS